MNLSPDNYLQVEKWTDVYKDALDGKYASVDECFAGVCYKVDKTEYFKAAAHAAAEAIRDENFNQIIARVQKDLDDNVARLEQEEAISNLVQQLIESGLATDVTKVIREKGQYKDVGGHHIHAKAGFSGHINYDSDAGFSISQEFMENMGFNHQKMTNAQRQGFKELYESGRANTLIEHSRIAVDALIAGGATKAQARDLVAESLLNLRSQLVTEPTRIPWYTK